METKLSYLGRNLVCMWCSRDRFMVIRDTSKADRYLPITLHCKQDKGRDGPFKALYVQHLPHPPSTASNPIHITVLKNKRLKLLLPLPLAHLQL